MSARSIQVRDAVVAALNAASAAGGFDDQQGERVAFGIGFTARPVRVVSVTLPDGYEGIDVMVVATEIKTSVVGRDVYVDAVSIDIGVKAHIDRVAAEADDFAAVDPLVAFVEMLRDCLLLGAVEAFDVMPQEPSKIEPLYDQSKLMDASTFISVATVVYAAELRA
ncbi:MAG: hypothetical protein QM775_16670 [Pirellulales bacterium]